MIKVSTRGDYGTVLMAYLARNYARGMIPLSEIAKNERLSFSYLQRLVSPLRKAGLLVAKEGVDGGIGLSRNPSKISMGEIVSVLEGPLELVRCTRGKGSANCPIVMFCHSQKPWQKILKMLSGELNRMTLKEVANG